MKGHIINFRITDQEHENLDKLMAWVNADTEERREFRSQTFRKYWGQISISAVLRWQLGRAHDVIQAEISGRKTKDLEVERKTMPARSPRKTKSRSSKRNTKLQRR